MSRCLRRQRAFIALYGLDGISIADDTREDDDEEPLAEVKYEGGSPEREVDYDINLEEAFSDGGTLENSDSNEEAELDNEILDVAGVADQNFNDVIEDRILAAAYLVVESNIPRARWGLFFELADLVKDGPKVISLKDTADYLTKIDEMYHVNLKLFCAVCKNQIESTVATCDNEICSAYKKTIKLDKKSRWIGIADCDFVEQFRRFVEKYFYEILTAHVDMEERNSERDGLYELFHWPLYVQAKEDVQERQNHVLRVSLIVNTDGYRSPGPTRNKSWKRKRKESKRKARQEEKKRQAEGKEVA